MVLSIITNLCTNNSHWLIKKHTHKTSVHATKIRSKISVSRLHINGSKNLHYNKFTCKGVKLQVLIIHA